MKKRTYRKAQISVMDEIIVDNFAGGGGASTGIELAVGRPVDIAINHDPAAILMHQTNHPYTEHYQASVWDVDPKTVCRGRPVGLAWFSPDCKHFSKAKGAALVDKKIRGLAWIVLRWAGTVRPRVIILENVEEFQTWGPVRKGKPRKSKKGQTFRKWLQQLRDLDYEVEYRELVAADYGAPTTRKRFVLVARCDGKPIVWPEPTHAPRDNEAAKSGKLLPWRSAAEIIDWSQPMYSIFASKQEIKEKYGVNVVRPLADNTQRRVIRGVDKFTIKSGKPFLVPVGYGERAGQAPRVHNIDDPLPTVVSSGKHHLVEPMLAPITLSNTGGSTGAPANKPVGTVRTGGGGQIFAAANLMSIGQTGGGDRVRSAGEPLHTVTSHDREALTAAHVVEFKGQDIGQDARRPLRTITAGSGEFAVAGVIVKKYSPGIDPGNWPKVRELLNQYCGYGLADDEVILLNIDGRYWYISDITMRMLIPMELYCAMGFPADYIIDRDYTGAAYVKKDQVARCGNAVCPPMAEAVVRANLPEWCDQKIRTMQELMDMVAV